MKIFNKVISSICAVAMLSTMAVSMVHAGETQPKLLTSVSYTDDTKTAGTISFSLSGATGDEVITYLQSSLEIPAEKFVITGYYNIAYYMQKKVLIPAEQTIDDVPYVVSGTVAGAKHGATATDILNVGISEMSAFNLITEQPEKFPVKATLFTLDFKLVDGVESASIKMTGTKVGGDGWFYGTSDTIGATKTLTVDTINVGKVEEPVDPPTPDKPSVPENTGTTADSNTIKAFNPADLGLTPASDGYFAPDADYANANDRAIAVANNFAAPGAFNKIKWTMSRTPVGGVAETASLTKSIANIDTNAAITVGMVVGFDISQYSAVSITNVELINE